MAHNAVEGSKGQIKQNPHNKEIWHEPISADKLLSKLRQQPPGEEISNPEGAMIAHQEAEARKNQTVKPDMSMADRVVKSSIKQMQGNDGFCIKSSSQDKILDDMVTHDIRMIHEAPDQTKLKEQSQSAHNGTKRFQDANRADDSFIKPRCQNISNGETVLKSNTWIIRQSDTFCVVERREETKYYIEKKSAVSTVTRNAEPVNGTKSTGSNLHGYYHYEL